MFSEKVYVICHELLFFSKYFATRKAKAERLSSFLAHIMWNSFSPAPPSRQNAFGRCANIISYNCFYNRLSSSYVLCVYKCGSRLGPRHASRLFQSPEPHGPLLAIVEIKGHISHCFASYSGKLAEEKVLCLF